MVMTPLLCFTRPFQHTTDHTCVTITGLSLCDCLLYLYAYNHVCVRMPTSTHVCAHSERSPLHAPTDVYVYICLYIHRVTDHCDMITPPIYFYIYIYKSMYIYTYVCVYEYRYIYIYIDIYIYVCMYVCMYISRCIHKCMSILSIYANIYKHTYIYINISYIYIHTYIHTSYIHVYIHSFHSTSLPMFSGLVSD
jgi:hypothetical protein